MNILLIVFHLLITLSLIGVILLQKGEEVSAGLASGSSMFTARGAKNIFSRITAVLAAVVFANCLLLAYLIRREAESKTAKKISATKDSKAVGKDGKSDIGFGEFPVHKEGDFLKGFAPEKPLPSTSKHLL